MRARFNSDKEVTVQSGRFKGETFRIEATIDDMEGAPVTLEQIANRNWAARNALDIDGYTEADKPFYYGKIGSLGYIISAKDLGI